MKLPSIREMTSFWYDPRHMDVHTKGLKRMKRRLVISCGLSECVQLKRGLVMGSNGVLES